MRFQVIRENVDGTVTILRECEYAIDARTTAEAIRFNTNRGDVVWRPTPEEATPCSIT